MIIQDQQSLIQLQESLASSNAIAIDTETNVTDNYEDRFLVGIAVSTPNDSFYIPIGHTDTLFGTVNFEDCPRTLFTEFSGKIFMHNAKFDLHVLGRAGFDIPVDYLFDTMLISHLLDENPPHGLKELAKIRLGIEESKELQKQIKQAGSHFGWEAVPAWLMAKYAEQDTRMTFELYYDMLPEVESWADFKSLWDVDREFMLLLKQIEASGLTVDQDLARSLANDAESRMLEIRHELGFDPAKPTQLAYKLFSTPPLGLGLKPRSFGRSDRPTMDADYLESIGHPVTALCLEYRGLVKAKSSYFEAYARLAGKTGRLHPNFKQHGTLTGRLSCENPNLQQVPRDSAVKKLFIPDEGYELWEFDYRNIEMRLAAVYSQDEALVSTFKEEGDIHQLVANQLGISRQHAKVINFLILYGGGPKKLAEQLKVTQGRAADILRNYKATYPGLARVLASAEEVAEENNYVKMWTGRRRHFQYSSEYHKAFNAIIQGGAFEIVKRGMLQVSEYGYDIRNQVHDSIWVHIPKKEVNNARQEIPKLLSGWTEEIFGLSFTTDEKKLN